MMSPDPSGSPQVRTATARWVVLAASLALIAAGLFGALVAISLTEGGGRSDYRLPFAVLFFVVSVIALGLVLVRRGESDRRQVATKAASTAAETERMEVEAERTLAEAALAVDHERFMTLLEHSHDVIAVMTPGEQTAFISDAITRLTGRTPANLIGRPTFEHVHTDDLTQLRQSFAECLSHPGTTLRAEFRVQKADGHFVWLEAIGTNHLDNPAVGGVVVNIRDVTERRMTEDRLRAAQALLESTGRLARIGGWEYVIPDDRLTWSEQTYRIHEVRPGAYTPSVADAIDFYAPEARPEIRAVVERGMSTGEPWNLVLPFITDAGRRLWVNSIGHVELVDNKPYRLYGTFQDVTERVANARAVERSEARYRNLFESAPVAIWEEDLTAIATWFGELREAGVSDLAAHLAAHPGLTAAASRMIRVHDVNRSAVVMNRAADKADLVHKHHQLFTSDSMGTLADELIAIWNGLLTLRVEGKVMRLDGAAADVVMHIRVPEVAGQPDFAHVIVIILDVTDQKRLEDQVRQSQKLEAIGRLAGGIAHDFNNLLTVINGFAELVLADAPLGSEVRELTTHIRDAGMRAADLTRQLLAFSRKQPAASALLDLAAVIGDLTPLLAPLLGADVRLVNQLDPVPFVRADKGQLESVVMNLVINARDAMPRGGTLTVRTAESVNDASDGTDSPPGRWVVLSVADTGTGIPDDVRPHLFEPFFTTKELGKGTGLGLPTAYGIVTSAGGHLRYHTVAGQGTTFRVFLPPESEESGSAASNEKSVAHGEPVHSGDRTNSAHTGAVTATKSYSVLLVEDLPAVRNLSAHILADAGYSVTAAEDGAEALAKLAAMPEPIDVLVTDIQMPGMNGRELAARVRALQPDVQVLFISGFAPEQSWADEAFLPKPFSPEELNLAVRSAAERKPAG